MKKKIKLSRKNRGKNQQQKIKKNEKESKKLKKIEKKLIFF